VVEQGWTLTAAAAAAGVSVRCVRKWVARYRLEGERGLQDRSSAPKRVAWFLSWCHSLQEGRCSGIGRDPERPQGLAGRATTATPTCLYRGRLPRQLPPSASLTPAGRGGCSVSPDSGNRHRTTFGPVILHAGRGPRAAWFHDADA
jgi:hypothetical protein